MFDFSELIFLTLLFFFFFFNDTATPEIYPLSLHDALPICEELHHLAAWLRASSFEEAQMARGDSRLGRDRKSTRLNSSHGYISYAVFCLKKKKKKKTTALRDGTVR